MTLFELLSVIGMLVGGYLGGLVGSRSGILGLVLGATLGGCVGIATGIALTFIAILFAPRGKKAVPQSGSRDTGPAADIDREASYRELLSIEWLGAWRALLPEERAKYERELERELPPAHPLKGHRISALGRKEGIDDFLFLVHFPTPRLAYVHLTWQKETDPKWPRTEMYSTAQEWVEGFMRPDSDGWPEDKAT